jgi:hypothetical protein
MRARHLVAVLRPPQTTVAHTRLLRIKTRHLVACPRLGLLLPIPLMMTTHRADLLCLVAVGQFLLRLPLVFAPDFNKVLDNPKNILMVQFGMACFQLQVNHHLSLKLLVIQSGIKL